MIRVAFCHYTADVCGGSDRSLMNLVTHLPSDAFTPVLFLKTGDPMAAAYRDREFEVHELPFYPPRRALEWGKLVRFFLYFWPTVFRLAWRMRRARIDVVHVNTVFNIQGGVAARMAGIPLVWHVRELVEDSVSAAAVRTLAAKLSHHMIANSAAVAATLPRQDDCVHVVLNGIDLELFEPLPDPGSVRGELGISEASPVITVIGRLERWKGQHIFIEAIPLVLEAHPDAHFLVVGGPAVNKPEYLPALQARCDELGVKDAVHFTGVRHDIPAILTDTDVFVLPSVTPEPFGLTVIEAMAAGVATIATRHGGPLEIIEDGITGVFAPPEDPAALAATIKALTKDSVRRTAMGKAARAAAFTRFTLERVAAEAGAILTAAASRK